VHGDKLCKIPRLRPRLIIVLSVVDSETSTSRSDKGESVGRHPIAP